jgi:DNA repair exonuclease SbcCD ATPase subunit
MQRINAVTTQVSLRQACAQAVGTGILHIGLTHQKFCRRPIPRMYFGQRKRQWRMSKRTFRENTNLAKSLQSVPPRKERLVGGLYVSTCSCGFSADTLPSQLQDELVPLKQRQKSKETEKNRLKALASEDEERLRSTKEAFTAALKELKDIGQRIEEFQSSTTEDELAGVERKKAEFAKKRSEKNSHLRALGPELDRVSKAVDDQNRHKKNLSGNIALINKTQLVEKLKKEISKMEQKKANVEGHETVEDDCEVLNKRKEEILKATARLEGKRGEILENVRSVKVGSSLCLCSVIFRSPPLNLSIYSANFLLRNTRKLTRSIAWLKSNTRPLKWQSKISRSITQPLTR